MGCKEFKWSASSFVDRRLDADEAARFQAHLDMCADCRSYVADIRQVSLMLKGIEPPGLPEEIHGNVMSAVRLRTAGEVKLGVRVIDLLQKLNPSLVSYGAGALVSAMLFGITLAGLKPIPSMGNMVAAYTPGITVSDVAYHVYNDIPPDSGLGEFDHAYQLPRVVDSSSLISFSNVAYQKPGNEGAAALVEVLPDGRGKLVEMLQEPSDPNFIDELKWSLSKRPFQPATRSGQPVQTRIVLLLQKIDVSG
jgi:hypothetical protein